MADAHRTTRVGAVTLALAFPIVLLSLAAALAREEAKAPRWEPGPISVVGGSSIGPIRREPTRWTTWFAQMMVSAVGFWALLAGDKGASLQLIVLGWWLTVAAFAGLVLPRLLSVPKLRV